MSISGQGHSLTLVKGHSDFKVKCLNFGLYTQVSDSGPLGPLVFLCEAENPKSNQKNQGVLVRNLYCIDVHTALFNFFSSPEQSSGRAIALPPAVASA